MLELFLRAEKIFLPGVLDLRSRRYLITLANTQDSKAIKALFDFYRPTKIAIPEEIFEGSGAKFRFAKMMIDQSLDGTIPHVWYYFLM